MLCDGEFVRQPDSSGGPISGTPKQSRGRGYARTQFPERRLFHSCHHGFKVGGVLVEVFSLLSALLEKLFKLLQFKLILLRVVYELVLKLPDLFAALLQLFVTLPDLFAALLQLLVALPDLSVALLQLLVALPDLSVALLQLLVALPDLFAALLHQLVALHDSQVKRSGCLVQLDNSFLQGLFAPRGILFKRGPVFTYRVLTGLVLTGLADGRRMGELLEQLLSRMGHGGRFVVSARGVEDIGEDFIAPRQAAGVGGTLQVVGELPWMESDEDLIAFPIVPDVQHALEMDGRYVQGVVIREDTMAASEDAHGNLVRRPHDKEGYDAHIGKGLENAAPERPKQRDARVFESGDRSGLDQLAQQRPAVPPRRIGQQFLRFPPSFVCAKPVHDFGRKRDIFGEVERLAHQFLVELVERHGLEMPVNVGLGRTEQFKGTQRHPEPLEDIGRQARTAAVHAEQDNEGFTLIHYLTPVRQTTGRISIAFPGCPFILPPW